MGERFDGAQFCVENPQALQAAMTAAQSNGEDDVIQLVQGQYDGLFAYESDEGCSIALLGGFTAGCLSRNLDPANTVLRGEESSQALSVRNTAGGDILLEGVTVQDGGGGFGANPGARLYASSSSDNSGDGPAGSINLRKNVFYRNGDRHASGVEVLTHAASGAAGEGQFRVGAFSGGDCCRT